MSKNFGLLGEHLSHTMSPYIHERLFELSNKKNDYDVFEISREDLCNKCSFLKTLSGYNITIPHKISIIRYIDSLDKSAKLYGVVNCVHNTDEGAIGYNTDAYGFLRALGDNKELLSKKVLLLGCGGAGTMMAFETAMAGGELTIAVRKGSNYKARKVKSKIQSKYKNVKINVCNFEHIDGEFDILLNSTPVGMYPNINDCLVSDEVIKNTHCIFDAIYNPSETVLISKAKQYSKIAIGGASMLVWQAVVSHEIWDNSKYDEKDIQKLIEQVEITVKKVFE